MATTKILQSDLDVDLQQLLTDLEAAKGTKLSLTDRLDDVDTNINAMQGDISTLQTNVSNLQTNAVSPSDINDLKTKMAELAEYGNFTQSFTYDSYGNVTQESSTGDAAYTETYVYTDAAAGTLNYSDKVYTDENGKTVTIHKVYTYDSATGNISGIAVTTTVA